MPISTCEIPEGGPPGWLCINRRPGHVALPEHQTNLVHYLSNRGVNNVRDLLRRYGVPAVDAVAAEIQEMELRRIDWSSRLRNPGAWVHSQVRARSMSGAAAKTEVADERV